MIDRFVNFASILLPYRRVVVIALHLVIIASANYVAFWLRFDGVFPVGIRDLMIEMLPWLVVLRAITFVPYGLYEGLWRYTGIWDLRNIILAIVTSSIGFYLLVHWGLGNIAYPRSIYFIDGLVLLVFMGGIRMIRRLTTGIGALRGGKRVLIYGAGDTGESILRSLLYTPSFAAYGPIGFIDNDHRKAGHRIHGVKVLGDLSALPTIVEREQIDEVWLAISQAPPEIYRNLLEVLRPYKVSIKVVTGGQDGKGHFSPNQIRQVSFDDLLERAPVGLDLEPVRQFLTGKRVLVTGAGGSIGSELCRQISKYEPELLILLDKSEEAIYTADMELSQKFPKLPRVSVLADIKNHNPLRDLFERYRPQIVFHAAAYKHVPLMEGHPSEAVWNNVIGTKRLCNFAVDSNVETFIMISTDKAVNPTNMMGATKRIGELLMQSLCPPGKGHKTVFAAVRFGNVLGSSGSVVPLFQRQIEQGGPVTVTHPEIERYFMTIPEAVQLVLRAAPLARGGEIFVLDMGEQIKLVEMARNLIRLHGFLPDREIHIEYIGLRPGEKLREELVAMDEVLEPSGVEKIMKVRSGWLQDFECLSRKVAEMEKHVALGNSQVVVQLVCDLVKTFRPLADSEQLPSGHEVVQPTAIEPSTIAIETRTAKYAGTR